MHVRAVMCARNVGILQGSISSVVNIFYRPEMHGRNISYVCLHVYVMNRSNRSENKMETILTHFSSSCESNCLTVLHVLS